MHPKLTRVANLHQKADMPDYGEEVYVYGTMFRMVEAKGEACCLQAIASQEASPAQISCLR